MRTYPPKVCEMCRQAWTPTTRYQAARNRTCSKACAAKLHSQTMKGRPAHNDQRITVPCAECATPVKISQAWAKRNAATYCSRKCNGAARGREWAKHASKGRAAWTPESEASYRLKMTGELNPAWKGGVMTRRGKGNYVGPRYVRCPVEFLPMARKDGYIMEHRLVMAQWIGRMLTREECVNHKNHDPRDNRRENLELYPTNGDHKRGEVGRFVDGVHNRLFRTV